MVQTGDKLKFDYINSLPQPFMGVFIGGDEWPIEDIDVQTGLLRIDVCGKIAGEAHRRHEAFRGR